MSKSRPRTAFPARTNAMGYQDGLTKLEWIVTQLTAARLSRDIMSRDAFKDGDNYIINLAKDLLKACEDAEKAV